MSHIEDIFQWMNIHQKLTQRNQRLALIQWPMAHIPGPHGVPIAFFKVGLWAHHGWPQVVCPGSPLSGCRPGGIWWKLRDPPEMGKHFVGPKKWRRSVDVPQVVVVSP